MGRKKRELGPEIMGILTVFCVFLASALMPGPPSGAEMLENTPSPAPTPSESIENVHTETPGPAKSETIRVATEGGVVEVELEEYVARVLCAEMPAAFEMEALKAQAVAARTYALQRRESGVHGPDADVCGDPACCQGYRPPETWEGLWGAEAALYGEKLREAAASTAGEVLTYDGALIQAAFHSCSLGTTEEAEEVWGRAVPYLTRVPTPETGDEVPGLETTVELDAAALRALTAEIWPTADFSGPPENWVVIREKTAAGHVKTALVGGVTATGQEVRTALGLRSTAFDTEAGRNTLVLRVKGYGHGVGMSQYGANALAGAGWDHRAILAHYYPGTALERA